MFDKRCFHCGAVVPDAPFCNQCGSPMGYPRGDMEAVTPAVIERLFLEANKDHEIARDGFVDSLPDMEPQKHEQITRDLSNRIEEFNKDAHLQGLPTVRLCEEHEDRDRINISVTAVPQYTVHCGCGAAVHSGQEVCPKCGMQHWQHETVANFYKEIRDAFDNSRRDYIRGNR